MLSIKSILHPTDFSPDSGYALRMACALAADYSASLTILHVIGASLPAREGFLYPSQQTHQENLRSILEHLEIPDERVDVIRRLQEGNPGGEILRLAELCRADLIVMGLHGRHGLKQLLVGSVAEQVVRVARCPVLTVTTPLDDASSCELRRPEESAAAR
jgi:nucleotide-binding universal stress UspA family protein